MVWAVWLYSHKTMAIIYTGYEKKTKKTQPPSLSETKPDRTSRFTVRHVFLLPVSSHLPALWRGTLQFRELDLRGIQSNDGQTFGALLSTCPMRHHCPRRKRGNNFWIELNDRLSLEWDFWAWFSVITRRRRRENWNVVWLCRWWKFPSVDFDLWPGWWDWK